MKQNSRPALGRGLSALVSTQANSLLTKGKVVEKTIDIQLTKDADVERDRQAVLRQEGNGQEGRDLKQGSTVEGETLLKLNIDQVIADPQQPRRDFGESELLELADSIKKLGLLQPIIVRKINSASAPFQIIAGERRWRASKLAGLTQVPVIIKDVTDKVALELAIVENVQREDLNPVEHALGYDRLSKEFGLSQEEIASRVGKDRASIANYLRLLKLPTEVLEALKNGDISMGHAKAILAIKDPQVQVSLARKVIKEELSVRELESVAGRMVILDAGKRSSLTQVAPKDSVLPQQTSFEETTERLRRKLGTKVELRHNRSGKGKIEIVYYSEQELDRLVQLICDD